MCFRITLIHIAKLAEILGEFKGLLSINKAYKKSSLTDCVILFTCFYLSYIKLIIFKYLEVKKISNTPFNSPLNYPSLLATQFLDRQAGQYSPLFSVNLLQNFTSRSQRNYGYFSPMSTLSGNGNGNGDLPAGFLEWLCGLTDGEGNFYIRRRSINTPVYSFKYSIGTHIDDIDMLYFIRDTLGMGKVFTTGKVAQYEVYDLKNIKRIIEIFTQHPLNTTKLLNFLDFKRAYDLYKGPNRKSSAVTQEIANIKQGMNSTRVSFEMPKGYQPRITPH